MFKTRHKKGQVVNGMSKSIDLAPTSNGGLGTLNKKATQFPESL